MLGGVGCQPDSKHHDPLSLTAILVELLQDSSPDVRRTAALSLGKIGHSAGTQGLVEALSDPDPLVREYSAWALGQIGEEVNTDATIALVSALGDENQSVKNTAAKALGNVGLREPMVPLLVEGLTVGEVQSRRAVVQALMQLEVKEAYAALIASLKDNDPQVRQGAIAALGELGARQALPKFQRSCWMIGTQGFELKQPTASGNLAIRQTWLPFNKLRRKIPLHSSIYGRLGLSRIFLLIPMSQRVKAQGITNQKNEENSGMAIVSV